MIKITTKTKSINIDNVIETNKGTFTITRWENRVIVRGGGYEFMGTYSDFNCDGVVHPDIDTLCTWLSANLFYDGGGSGEGLQKATLEDLQEGTDNEKYTTPFVIKEYIDWRVALLLIEDPTGVPYTTNQLDEIYPDAEPRTVVDCFNIQTKYTKLAESRWEEAPYGLAP